MRSSRNDRPQLADLLDKTTSRLNGDTLRETGHLTEPRSLAAMAEDQYVMAITVEDGMPAQVVIGYLIRQRSQWIHQLR